MAPRIIATALVASIAVAALPATAQSMNPRAVAPALSPSQEAAIEQLFSTWLERNPDAVLRAVEAARAARETVNGSIDPMDAIIGPREGADVTLVAFVDRGSPSSRAAIPVLVALAAGDPGLRVVIKELPLASEASVASAATAVAARALGDTAFRTFEGSILGVTWPPSQAELATAATAAGLRDGAVGAARSDEAILAYLSRTRALASSLQVAGTPAFLIGRTGIVGLRTVDELAAAVADARAAGASR